jgi:hypothetical protein
VIDSSLFVIILVPIGVITLGDYKRALRTNKKMIEINKNSKVIYEYEDTEADIKEQIHCMKNLLPIG